MSEHSAGAARLDRRELLRWMGAAGVASIVPWSLTGCEPVTTPQPLAPDPSLQPLGFVGGTDVQLSQGGWCWFQSPRASFGPNGVLWLGSSVSNTNTALDGAVQATAYDTKTGTILTQRTVAVTREDDHTSPSVMTFGDKVQIAWSLHQSNDYIDIAETAVNGALVTRRVHRPGAVTAPGRGMAYASAHVVSGQRWMLYRGEQFSWNLLTSADGISWTSRGLVVRPGTSGDRPYLHATSDGTRLHLAVTNGNPTEYRGNSVYVGSIDADFKMRSASGAVVGTVGLAPPTPNGLTRLAAGSAGASESTDSDMWLCDLRVLSGRPAGIVVRRDPWPAGADAVGNYRHRYFWIRQRSTGWLIESMCFGGGELSVNQPDYAALATQDPSDVRRVVVSTNVHPVTGVPLRSSADHEVHYELFEGYRVAEGEWQWTPLTQNSTEDNIRPVIAAGGKAKALAWMRGTYTSWTSFDTRLVVRNAFGTVGPPPPPTTTTTSTSTTSTSTTSTSTTSTTSTSTTSTTSTTTSSTTSTTEPASTTTSTSTTSTIPAP